MGASRVVAGIIGSLVTHHPSEAKTDRKCDLLQSHGGKFHEKEAPLLPPIRNDAHPHEVFTGGCSVYDHSDGLAFQATHCRCEPKSAVYLV